MRKSNFLFCIFFLTSLFISCEHSLDVKPHGNQETSTCTVIKGFLTDKFSGAAPADFENLQPSQNSSARNAIPEVTINDLQYEIYACKYDSLNGTEDTSTRVDVPDDKFNSSTMTFEIELPDAVWKIHAKGSDSSGNLLVDGSSVITINSFESSGNGNDTDQTINISLHLAQSATGTGTVNLPFSFESDSLINYIEATWKDLDGGSHTKTMLSSPFIFDMNSDDYRGTAGIPSGVYKVTFRFYNSLGSTSCLYVIPEEEIMVLPGQTTSKWINNANSQYISDSGSFSITNEMIRAAHKNVYVEAKNDASDETPDPDPDSTGSRYEPFSSIRKAFDYFAAIDGDHPESIEHQIIVSGEISVTQKYDSSKVYYFPVTNQKLTIKGLNSSTPGTIKCALDNNNDPITSGCAFFVAEDAILELGENLTVSHFVNKTNSSFQASSVEGNGGAVYIAYGGQLILNSCKIKNCKASCGSAIFLYSDEDIIFSGRPQVDGYTYFDGSGSFYLENDFDTTSNNNKYYVSFNIDEDHLNTYKIISKDSALSSYDYNTNFEVCGYSGVHFPGYFPINQNGEIIGSIPTPQVTASMPSTIYVGTNILDDYDYDGIDDIASRYISIVTSGMGECDDIVDVSYTWEINGVTLLNSAMSASPFAYSTVDFCEGVTKVQVELRNDFGQSENYEWSIKCDSKYNSLGTNYQSGTLGTVAIVDEEGTPVSILQKNNASTKNIVYSDFIGTDIVQTCINQANSQTGLSWRLPTVAEAVSLSFACNFDYDIIWLEGGYVIDISSGYFLEGDTYDIPEFAPSIRLIADVSSTPGVPGDSDYTNLDSFTGTLTITSDGKYTASTETGLRKFAEAWNTIEDDERQYTSEIKLTDNIVLTGEWTPINKFKGTFDGNGKTISNLNVLVSDNSGAGFIGSIGNNSGSAPVIKNLNVSGKVNGTENAGGIIGTANYIVTIDNCTNYADISGTKTVGGIIGNCAVYNSVIGNCINYGSVTATEEGVGGIVGTGSSISVQNSANFGNVTGSDRIGGIAGSGSNLTITNSFNAGTVKVTGSNPSAYGSISGISVSNVNNVWYEDNTCKDNTVYAKQSNPSNLQYHKFVYSNETVSGKQTLVDLKIALNNYVEDKSDFNSWNGYYNAYPVFSGNSGIFDEEKANIIYVNNLYTSSSTYNPDTVPSAGKKCVVGSKDDITYISTMVSNGNTLKGVTFVVHTDKIIVSGWTPIGNSTNPFKGNFDGNGCTITISSFNSTYTSANNSDFGFFGYVEDAEIKNLTVDGNPTIGSNKSNIGGIAGRVKATENGYKVVIDNCNSYIFLNSSSGENFGGIVGKIENWTNSDAVTNVVIKNCNNKGNIVSKDSAGGIAGYSQHDCSIINCCNLGEISVSSTGAGGIVGKIGNTGLTYPAVISNCVNLGSISGISSGSIVGICDTVNDKTFENLFYLRQVSLNVISTNSSYPDCYEIEKSGDAYVLVAGQDLGGDVLSLLIDNARNAGWADWTADDDGKPVVDNR